MRLEHRYEGKTGGFVSVRLALVRGFFTKFAVACNADKATSEFQSASRDLVVDRGTVECKQEFPQNAADARSNVYVLSLSLLRNHSNTNTNTNPNTNTGTSLVRT